MTGATAATATRMIERSDNAAAYALYPKVGGDGLEPWIAAHYGVSGLGAPPTMPGIWGSTQLTAAASSRCTRSSRPTPRSGRGCRSVCTTTSSGPRTVNRTRSGSPPPSRRRRSRTAWDINRDPAHPTNAIVNSTGFVGGDRYAVAVLAEGGSALYYAGGEAVVTHQAELITAATAAAPVTTAAAPLVRARPRAQRRQRLAHRADRQARVRRLRQGQAVQHHRHRDRRRLPRARVHLGRQPAGRGDPAGGTACGCG